MPIPLVVTGLKCLKCDDVIWSRSVHDWRPCKCGSIFIDGGREYVRFGGAPGTYCMVKIDTDTNKVVGEGDDE